MPACVVKYCKNNSTKHKKSLGITFHRIRTDNNIWINIIRHCRGEKHWMPSKTSVICSAHFEENDLFSTKKGRCRITSNAIPKLLLFKHTDVRASIEPLASIQMASPTSPGNLSIPQVRISTSPGNSSIPQAMRTQQPACRCCLAVDGKLVSIHTRDFAQLYQDVTGLSADCTDRFPQHVCVFCLRSLQKFAQFRARCHKALEVLYQSLVHGNEVTREYIGFNELKPQFVQTQTLAFDTDGTIVNASDINMISLDIPEVPVEHIIKTEVPIEHTLMEVQKCEIDTESLYICKNEESFEEYLEPIEEALVDVLYEGGENDKIVDLGSFANSTDKVKIEVTKPIKHKKTVKKCEPKTDELSEKDYAASLGFELTELSLEEQIKEIEEKKSRPGFVCELCGKSFYNSNCLQRHKHCHEVKPKSLVCDLCTRVFNKRSLLIRHILSHRQTFSCKSCDFKTNMRCSLQRHHEFHQGKQYPCKYCDKVITKATSYFSHMKYKHEAELPWCDLCGEPFINEKGLIGHKTLNHNIFDQYPYTCVCSKKFKTEAALDRHLTVQGCDLPSCVHCGESFPVAQMLKHHLIQRHIEGALPDTFDCKSCVFRFYNQDALTRHACGACAACAQCGDSFETTQQLVDHTALLHEKLTCHECWRDVNLNNFKMHFLMSHVAGAAPRAGAGRRARGRARRGGSTIRKWRVVDGDTIVPESVPPPARAPAVATHICEVCGKGFAAWSNLCIHRESAHSAARKYRCQLCPKAFKTKAVLEIHTRVHTGERPFQCTQCPKAFKNYAALSKHSLVHSGVRNHVCSICDKTFQTSTSVKLHIKTVHMKMPWPARKRRARPDRRKDAAQYDTMM